MRRLLGLIAVMLIPVGGQAQSWTDLNVLERVEFTATLLNDGRVLVAGGRNSLGQYVDTAVIYDGGSQTWTPTGTLAQGPRGFHSAVRLDDGRVMIAGGFNGFSILGAEIYDPSSGSWTVSAMQDARGFHPSLTTLVGGRVLVAGGSTGASAEVYDPANDTWTYTGSLSATRSGHSATRLNDGRVLVFGGKISGCCYVLDTSAELYDPNTGSWTPTPPMNSVRSSQGVLLDDGTVLVAGGPTVAGWSYGNVHDATAELYVPDGGPGTWQPTGSLGAGRDGHSAAKLKDGRVLVAGGSPAGQAPAFASAEVYDPTTRTWTPTVSMNHARRYQIAMRLPNGRVLVLGGEFWGNQPIMIPELYRP